MGIPYTHTYTYYTQTVYTMKSLHEQTPEGAVYGVMVPPLALKNLQVRIFSLLPVP